MRSETVPSVDSFFAVARPSLRPRWSWEIIAFKLEAELFRLLDSRYVPVPLDLMDGAGLGGLAVGRLFMVAEAGIRGGGMESCFAVF